MRFLIPGGDWNGHEGRATDGFEEVHGGYGYGVQMTRVVGSLTSLWPMTLS